MNPQRANEMKRTDNRALRLRNGVKLKRTTAKRNITEWALLGSNGGAFYEYAHEMCESIAKKYGLNIYQVAGIIASLSPQTPWDRNIELAEKFCKNGAISGVPKDRLQKCSDILKLTCRDRISKRVFGVAGFKVHAFYWNIVGDVSRVTIDSHAVFSAFNSPIAYADGDTYSMNRGPKNSQYRFLESVYVECAKELGTDPRELQARVWANVRTAKGLREHAITASF